MCFTLTCLISLCLTLTRFMSLARTLFSQVASDFLRSSVIARVPPAAEPLRALSGHVVESDSRTLWLSEPTGACAPIHRSTQSQLCVASESVCVCVRVRARVCVCVASVCACVLVGVGVRGRASTGAHVRVDGSSLVRWDDVVDVSA